MKRVMNQITGYMVGGGESYRESRKYENQSSEEI